MATEDHDFEEINYFNFKGKKVHWNKDANGAVGELSTEGLEAVFNSFSSELGTSKNAEYLKTLFKEAYLNHDNLAEATRFLANTLFKDYGLVILDANERMLKKKFVPFMVDEVINKTAYESVTNTNGNLSEQYGIQVNPREINLFYLAKNLRERIVFENNTYKVNNTNISWNKDEIATEILDFPERFSPNVIMRPLYQEIILPN